MEQQTLGVADALRAARGELHSASEVAAAIESHGPSRAADDDEQPHRPPMAQESAAKESGQMQQQPSSSVVPPYPGRGQPVEPSTSFAQFSPFTSGPTSNVGPVDLDDPRRLPPVRVGLQNNNLQVWDAPTQNNAFMLNDADREFMGTIRFPDRNPDPALWDEDSACCGKRLHTVPCSGGTTYRDVVSATFKGFPEDQKKTLEEIAAFPLEVQYELDVQLMLDGKKQKFARKVIAPPQTDNCENSAYVSAFDSQINDDRKIALGDFTPGELGHPSGANPLTGDSNEEFGVARPQFDEEAHRQRWEEKMDKYRELKKRFEQQIAPQPSEEDLASGACHAYKTCSSASRNYSEPAYIPTLQPAPVQAGWWSGKSSTAEGACAAGSGVSRCNFRM